MSYNIQPDAVISIYNVIFFARELSPPHRKKFQRRKTRFIGKKWSELFDHVSLLFLPFQFFLNEVMLEGGIVAPESLNKRGFPALWRNRCLSWHHLPNLRHRPSLDLVAFKSCFRSAFISLDRPSKLFLHHELQNELKMMMNFHSSLRGGGVGMRRVSVA